MATSVQRLNAINSFLAAAEVDEWTAELFLDNNAWDVSEALDSYNDTRERYELLLPDSVYYKYRERYSSDEQQYDSGDEDPLIIPYDTPKEESVESEGLTALFDESETSQENEEIEENDAEKEETCTLPAPQLISQRSEVTV